jgi:hypothetical protein
MGIIQASPESLLRQAKFTAQEYMVDAITEIDALFGEGYAKKHPSLVAGYMNTAALDFASSIQCKSTEEALELIATSLSDICDALRSK